jgi:ketosteroid isomerase-like protein
MAVRHRDSIRALAAGNGDSSAAAGRSNLDVVRGVYEMRFDRGRPASLDASASALASALAPSVEFERRDSDPETEAIEGLDEVERLMRSASETWDSFRFELRHLIETGDGRVVAAGRFVASGRHHGPRVEVPFANVWTMRDGRAVRVESYSGLAEARNAAGLPG